MRLGYGQQPDSLGSLARGANWTSEGRKALHPGSDGMGRRTRRFHYSAAPVVEGDGEIKGSEAAGRPMPMSTRFKGRALVLTENRASSPVRQQKQCSMLAQPGLWLGGPVARRAAPAMRRFQPAVPAIPTSSTNSSEQCRAMDPCQPAWPDPASARAFPTRRGCVRSLPSSP